MKNNYSNHKKVHAIILARGGSKGIKNKNLILINNKPLIYWSIKSALKCKNILNVWVSSDSEKILKVSKKLGANIIKRPRRLSGDISSSESGWLHAINYIKKHSHIKFVVALQATSPLRDKNDLTSAIKTFFINRYDSLFSSSINGAFFRWKLKNKTLKSNYNLDKIRPRRQLIDTELIENGSFYIFSAEKFIKNKKRLFGKIGTFIQNKSQRFEIDDFEDVFIIDSIMKNKSLKFKK
jgi:CMP-N-acetylneuraminic acid synthetase